MKGIVFVCSWTLMKTLEINEKSRKTLEMNEKSRENQGMYLQNYSYRIY